MKTQQIKWLNCSKAIAILAVLTDHTNGTLYRSPAIAYASYFSVSLFILLSGMTSYLSNEHHHDSWKRSVVRGCKKLLLSYCIAVAVYLVWITKSFDLSSYLNYLFHFNISSPHYFVLLYVQLMVVNRLLYNFLQKCNLSFKGYLQELLMLFAIVVFSIWTTNHTTILGVYGGGGKLLGGTYLILYYIGMLLIRHHCFSSTSTTKEIVILTVSGCLWYCLWRFICIHGTILDTYVPFGEGLNPPSISFMFSALCMLGFTFGFFSLLSRFKTCAWITESMAWLGKHTMSIFLYHILIFKYFLIPYLPGLPGLNMWLARFVYFAMMIVGSIAIQYVIDFCITMFRRIFQPAPD